jgi:hypothetical protein
MKFLFLCVLFIFFIRAIYDKQVYKKEKKKQEFLRQ